MRYVQMGDRQASVIGLGAWQFGSKGWGWGTEFDATDAHQIVRRALELGINLIDTAEMYGGGQSEVLVGDAVRDRRDQALIASKVSPHHLLRRSVLSAAARSLQRLDTDTIDLYQVHWPNPLVPAQWTMAAMRQLQEERCIGQVGVSNYSLARWRNAEAALGGPVFANQVRYHLLDRSAERELLPYAQANDRVIIAYSPLAQGLLSGRYRPDHLPRGVRLANPLFTPDNVRKVQPLLDVLTEVGAGHGVTPAQIALAWLVHHPNVIAIPGAKSVAQVEANATAADIELSEEESSAIAEGSRGFGPVSRVGSIPWLLRRLIRR